MENQDIPIKLDIIYGSIEICTREWREGDDLVMGGFSITRDRNGVETSRTKCEENCRLVGYYRPEAWAPHANIEWPMVAWACACLAFLAWLYR